MVLRFENVSKKMKGNPVLDRVSVTFEAGHIYGVRGRNGSGKTMLLKAAAGLLRPDEGRVLVDHQELGKDMDFPERIGVMFDQAGFPGALNAYENLETLASIKKEIGKKELQEVIVRVGLEEDKKKKYRQYSLGMRQKLNLAAAIMEKPELLLLDEPTNGLDDDSVIRLKKILMEEKERGTLILLVSHEMEELADIIDENYLMKEGHLEKE